jgi:hypothetical protein
LGSALSVGAEQVVGPLEEAIRRISQFQGDSLTGGLAAYELQFQGADREEAARVCAHAKIDGSLLAAASSIKVLASQINVVIHAAGILASLPHILEPGEVVQSLSTGAGNTGKPFDLETNFRVAEFKFINWRGGAESIRQNQLFKDFFYLCEAETIKKRELFVIGLTEPLKFLRSRRALRSVTSRNSRLAADLHGRYGERFKTVQEYYAHHKSKVDIRDLVPIIAALTEHEMESASPLVDKL